MGLWYGMAGQISYSHGAMITFLKDSPFPKMPKPTDGRRLMAILAYLGGHCETRALDGIKRTERVKEHLK